jgi:tetratricopeptide (TPR) repeat protein
MDTSSPIIQLCIQGTQAEFAGRPLEAADLYRQAWETASTDYEYCIAAHYVARFQPSPQDTLQWNQIALEHARLAGADEIKDFLPSLYLNLGQSYEALGNQPEAQRFFDLAASLGALHQP